MNSIQRKRELRLFVSSTFRDLQDEREYLIKKVFPEIRWICRMRGITFTEVDLRWGLTEEQQRLGRIIRTCLEEIDKCRPHFIGIIGRRYGWVPEYHEVIMDPEIQERYPWIDELSLEGVSLLEMEFTHGVLHEINNSATFYQNISVEPDVGESERLTNLIGKLQQKAYQIQEFSTPEHLGELVRKDLLSIIDSSWPLEEVPSIIGQERLTHEAFAHSRRRAYIPNPEYLQIFNQWLQQTTTPLVVTSESGMGKSALLTWLTGEYRRRHPGAFVIEHYVGASNDSTDHIGFIRRVITEIQVRYNIEGDIPNSVTELEILFQEYLARVGNVSGYEKDILFIALDAVDQLQLHSKSFAWLPKVYPETIKLLISCRTGDTLDELVKRDWMQLELYPLKDREREAIVARYLGEYHKALPADMLLQIGKDEKSASPLFLRTLSEELRLYGEHESLVDVVGQYLAPKNLEEFFVHILERMERDYGKDIVRSVTTALASSRSGLHESHLLGVSGVSRADLSMLLHALDYHILRNDGRLNFFHQYLRRAVESKYLATESSLQQSHTTLAAYFKQQYEEMQLQEDTKTDPSLIREMLYQYAACGDTSNLRKALLTPDVFYSIFQGDTEFEFLHYWKIVGEVDIAGIYQQSFLSPNPDVSLQLAHLYKSIGAWKLSETTITAAIKEIDQISPLMLRALGMLGEIQMLRGHPIEALDTFTKLQTYAHQLSNEQAIAVSLSGIGNILLERGEYDRALSSFTEVLNISTKNKQYRNSIRAFVKIGQILFYTGQYTDAMESYQSALDIIGITGDQRNRAVVLGQKGLIHWNRGEFTDAMECFRQEMDTAENIGDTHGYAMAAGKIGLVELDKGNLDSAEERFREYLLITQTLEYQRGIGYAHGDIGIVALRRNNYEVAMQEFDTALTIHRQIEYRAGVALWLRWKAETVLESFTSENHTPSSLKQAIDWVSESISISDKTGNRDSVFDSHVVQIRLIFFSGESEQALRALTRRILEPCLPYQAAELHYWLWKLFGHQMDMADHRKDAFALYTDLLQKTKKHLYDLRIKELSVNE